MNEVSKETFKEIFLNYGKASDGYGPDSWQSEFAELDDGEIRYLVSLPAHPGENRMMIVSDHQAKERRLFFLTEHQEDRFFTQP